MLTLLLVRHAKAERHGRGDDFERVLTAKGEADALALGKHMRAIGVLPALAVVSSATRTRQTFELFGKGADAVCPVQFEDDLYNASDQQLRDVLKGVEPGIETLMIVGHNPGIMDVAARLARDGDVADLGRLRDRFPPGCLALVAFDTVDWREARVSGGRLDLLLTPEDVIARN